MMEHIRKKFDVNLFSSEIEKLVFTDKISYLDAIVAFADKNDVEIETVSALVKRSLPILQKLEAESRRQNMLTKSSKASIESFL